MATAPYYRIVRDGPSLCPVTNSSMRDISSIASVAVGDYLFNECASDGQHSTCSFYKVKRKTKACVFIDVPTKGEWTHPNGEQVYVPGPPEEVQLRLVVTKYRIGNSSMAAYSLENKAKHKVFSCILGANDVASLCERKALPAAEEVCSSSSHHAH